MLPISVMCDLVEKVVKSPEVVDCTHAPSFGMSRRKRTTNKLFNAPATPTSTPATKTPHSFTCQFKLANRKVCGKGFDTLRGIHVCQRTT